MNKTSLQRHPWFFIPSLYFSEGVPYVLINSVAIIVFKRLGIANSSIAFWTELVAFVWVIKMFWGPCVDSFSTKRNWILWTELGLFFFLLYMSFVIGSSSFFFLSLLGLTIGAFLSATQDMAVDGFYMLALSQKDQAFFVGIRSLFYRFAMIFGSGFLVYLAGNLEKTTGNIAFSWQITFAVAAMIFLILFLYHRFNLPFPTEDGVRSLKTNLSLKTFSEIVRSYFQQKKIVSILAFILLYRLGEAMLVKMASPFLLDRPEVGGLGLSTEQVGLIYGTIGVGGLILGGILGGWLISNFGLKRCMWPMALALNLPDIFYIYLAYAKPTLPYVYSMVAAEQFGYGLGFSAFMVFLVNISKGPYKTSHFAISTGIMALGMRIPGMVSGFLQERLGYVSFFVWVCLLTIPGMITIFFLPHEEKKDSEPVAIF